MFILYPVLETPMCSLQRMNLQVKNSAERGAMPFKIFHLRSIVPVPHAGTCLLLTRALGKDKAKIKKVFSVFKY